MVLPLDEENAARQRGQQGQERRGRQAKADAAMANMEAGYADVDRSVNHARSVRAADAVKPADPWAGREANTRSLNPDDNVSARGSFKLPAGVTQLIEGTQKDMGSSGYQAIADKLNWVESPQEALELFEFIQPLLSSPSAREQLIQLNENFQNESLQRQQQEAAMAQTMSPEGGPEGQF